MYARTTYRNKDGKIVATTVDVGWGSTWCPDPYMLVDLAQTTQDQVAKDSIGFQHALHT